MRKHALIFPMILATYLTSGAASADTCALDLSTENVNILWSANFSFQAIPITAHKSSAAPCDFGVTFTSGGASDYNNRRMIRGAQSINYQLYGSSNLVGILKDRADITSSSEYLAGSAHGGKDQTVSLSYYVQIPSSSVTTPTIRAAGTYVDTYLVKAYEGTNSSDFITPLDTKSVSITTTVPKIIDLSLVNSGAPFDESSTQKLLDFGTLGQGVTRSFDILVRSNAGYSITLASQNRGVLKQASPSITTTVPYTLSVNGVPYSMNGSATVASGNGQTSLGGVRVPVTVASGSTENSMAGSYSDVITITATATE